MVTGAAGAAGEKLRRIGFARTDAALFAPPRRNIRTLSDMPKTFIGGNFYVRKRTLLLALVALLVSHQGPAAALRATCSRSAAALVEPRYSLADELQPAKEITVVVGTKDR